jgi:putative DNA primase/helicase
VAQCPAQGLTPYGSFEAWSDLVRNAVVWLGEADPCEGRQDLTAHADESYEQLAALLTAWQACFPPRADGTLQKRTLNQVKQEIGVYATRNAATPNTWDDLRDALIPFDQKFDGKVLDTNRLGNALRKVEGRVIDRTRFKRHGEYRHNACWQVDPV